MKIMKRQSVKQLILIIHKKILKNLTPILLISLAITLHHAEVELEIKGIGTDNFYLHLTLDTIREEKDNA